MKEILKTMLSQVKLLAWKQFVVVRTERSFYLLLVLPAILTAISSTLKFGVSTSTSTDLVECKIDNLMGYCNYPMKVVFDPPTFQDEFESDMELIAHFKTSADRVAKYFGTDYDTLFPEPDELDPTSKWGGEVIISEEDLPTYGHRTNIGRNDEFDELFINKLNGNPDLGGATTTSHPFPSFDLTFFAYIIILSYAANVILEEKETNMYYYLTRAGLLQSVYWLTQYTFWILFILISTTLQYFAARLTQVGSHFPTEFIKVWFFVCVGLIYGAIFKERKYLNAGIIVLFMLLVGIQSASAQIKDDTARAIFENIQYMPIFFVAQVSPTHIQVGGSVNVFLMILTLYFVPLFAVKPGFYRDSKVNYFYFLFGKFWREGIVAVPSYSEESKKDTEDEDCKESSLVYDGCMKRFGEEKVIGPMNVRLDQGKITVILGPSGVGKSTLLHIAAGYYFPSGGEVILNGKNTYRESQWSNLKTISYCPQDNFIYPKMTVDEHMYLMSNLRDMTRIDDDIETHITWILTTLDIAHKRSDLAENLSGGMKRRLCLAMSTVGFPHIILADEPSTGVDSVSQRGIWKLLEAAKQKSAILMTTHSSLESSIISDSVVVMKTSNDIDQNCGVESLTFSMKNVESNSTTEYKVEPEIIDEISSIIHELPNDGSEWKISSKSVSGETLMSFEDLSKTSEEKSETSVADDEDHETTNTSVPFQDYQSPNTLRQMLLLIHVMNFHVDRIVSHFFSVVCMIAQVVLACLYVTSFGDGTRAIFTALLPLIATFVMANHVVCLMLVLAIENEKGYAKLYFSAGISRFSYLFSNTLVYGFLMLPFSTIVLLVPASIYGTPAGMFAIFFLQLLFYYMIVGLNAMLGVLLSINTSNMVNFILLVIIVTFGLGPILDSFNDKFPGIYGQVIAGLMIDDVNQHEWNWYAAMIVMFFCIGSLSFYVFIAKTGNYNPLAKVLASCWNKSHEVLDQDEPDIEKDNKIGDEDVLLEGRSVVKSFGATKKNSSPFLALDDVNFSVTKGSLLGLVGKSGAGKSTLMDILSGQTGPTSGAVYVEGKRVSPKDISQVVSMCFQDDKLFEDMRVKVVIKIFMKCRGSKTDLRRSTDIDDPYVCYLIKELGIEECLKQKVSELSGGEKRRVSFLVSLLGNTRVVLIDEATSGVDAKTRQVMWKVMQNEVLLRERSIVVTSHDLEEVEQYCNTVGILHHGRLVEMGPLVDIKKRWQDSIKLVCLFTKLESVSEVGDQLSDDLEDDIVIQSPHIDVLVDVPEETLIVATFAMDLLDIKNIAQLIRTMKNASDEMTTLRYWSVEPQTLDDFVKAKSNIDVI